MKKSYITAVLIAVVAVLWLLSGLLTPQAQKGADNPSAAADGKKIMDVRVRRVQSESVAGDVVVTGRTYASRQARLRAETEGRIVKLAADKGDTVTKGQVIAQLEERDRRARVAEAGGRLKQREIEHTVAKSLETQGFNSKVRLAQTAADLEQARADLRKAETELAHTQITAPFEGIVFGQVADEGDFVAPGDNVFSIVDLDPIEVRGFVTEQQVMDLKTGVAARAEFHGGVVLEGTLSYIAPAADEATRTFEIEMSAPNPDFKITEGMTAQIHIAVQEKNADRISPSILSLDDDGRIGVKIVDAGNIVRFVPVKILSDHTDAMLVTGIPDQASIITVGQEFVVPGQTVRAIPADGADKP